MVTLKRVWSLQLLLRPCSPCSPAAASLPQTDKQKSSHHVSLFSGHSRIRAKRRPNSMRRGREEGGPAFRPRILQTLDQNPTEKAKRTPCRTRVLWIQAGARDHLPAQHVLDRMPEGHGHGQTRCPPLHLCRG